MQTTSQFRSIVTYRTDKATTALSALIAVGGGHRARAALRLLRGMPVEWVMAALIVDDWAHTQQAQHGS
jgi:hypothetical protein